MTGIVTGHSFLTECWLGNEMMQLQCLCCIAVTAAKHTGTTIQLVSVSDCVCVCAHVVKCLTNAYDFVVEKTL